MHEGYAKVIVQGSPISKSNFKLFNVNGRAILPVNSGKYHDRYAIYEEEIALQARVQNPNVVFTEGLIAILKVYYKSEKRHPDTNNIPKSIFDGIEKSGLIVNDAQVRKLIIEEFFDAKNPRFELELFSERLYDINYGVIKREVPIESKDYSPPSNKVNSLKTGKKNLEPTTKTPVKKCDICGKTTASDLISANKGNLFICKNCFSKVYK
ncbi:MAG: RusA family crossover junction endodeoxyribonuclease [Clostridiaceae bacterium]